MAKIVYPHIPKDDGKPAHLSEHPRPQAAQIVMDYLTHGWSPSEICRQHAYLNRAEVHAALTYYYDYKDEIDDEIRDEWDLAKSDRQEAKLPMFITDLQSAG
jgi:IS30 family transposase